MQPARAILVAFLSLAMLTSAALAQPASETKETGEVEVLVLAPDGHPVANADIQVSPPRNFPGPEAVASQTVRTDENGRAVVNWPAGQPGGQTMWVSVKGVGYGLTGLLEIVPGRKTKAFLPLLAPWATVRGQVPAEFMTADTKVRLGDRFAPHEVTLQPEKDGHFEAEVPAGTYWLSASGGGRRTAYAPGAFTILPGQSLTLPAMQKVPPEPAEEKAAESASEAASGNSKSKRQEVTWVSGTVRDTAGKPLADVHVCAFAVYFGGIRMYEMVRASKTDAAGRYTITGEGNLEAFSATLIAYSSEKCPTWSWLPPRPDWVGRAWEKIIKPPAVKGPAAPTMDFVLSDQGGTLEVEVVQDGKPVPNVSVGLWLEGANLKEIWAMGGNSPERRGVEQAVSPTGTTDEKGIARFEHLVPGAYQVIAGGGDEAAVRSLRERWRGQSGQVFGQAAGVAVRQGAVTRHRLAIGRQDTEVGVQVFRTDGKPLVGENMAIQWSHVGSGGGLSSSMKLDAEGRGRHAMEGVGLWHMAFQYRDEPTKTIPLQLPYYEAAGIVAASPRLPVTDPAQFRARPAAAPKVTVKMLDAEGKPLRGTVEIGSLPGMPVMVGSTGPDGTVRFEGLGIWPYKVYGFVPGFAPTIYGEDESALPEDAALRVGQALLPVSLTPQPNTDTTVVLKAQPVGYVRGVLKPPAGKKAGDYEVYPDRTDWERGAYGHYQRQTGAFVGGPFAPGKATLQIRESLNHRVLSRQEVTIKAGSVTEVQIAAPAFDSSRPVEPEQTMMGMGGISSRGTGDEALRGTVRLADGKTPAMGAMVFFLDAGSDQPSGAGIVDPTGAIQAHGSWRSNGGTSSNPEGPQGPVAIATLPGVCGAVVATPVEGKPLELTLPAPRELKGRVTVGGAAPAGLPVGQIRVLAAYEDAGRLNGLLSVNVTADADGKYVLAGLTPGTYQVQAALDDIWLSAETKVVVGAKPLADVDLAIGSPGGATTLTLTGSDGQPEVGQVITVDRPDGPLTKLCWPAEWTSDGAGHVFIPTLEVGEHVYHVKSDGSAHKFSVSPLKVSSQPEISGRVVDEETSAPVGGASISAYLRGAQGSLSANNMAVTSASGAWALPIPGTGDLDLQVKAPGYLPLQLKAPVVEGKPVTDFLIKLVHGATLRGTVFEADDATPAAKANVRLHSPRGHEWLAVTDAKGEFSVNALPPEKLVVTVTASGYISQDWTVEVPAHKDPPAQRLTMTNRGGTIRGTVISPETDKPLAERMVALCRSRDYGFKFLSVFDSLEVTSDDDPNNLLNGVGLHDAPHATTDAQGRFEIRNIPLGEWVALVLEKQLPPQPSETLVLDKGQTLDGVKLKLSHLPPGYLKLRIVKADGTPLAERTRLEYLNRAATEKRPATDQGYMWTSPDGHCYMPAPTGRHCTFTLTVPGYNIIRDEFDSTADRGSEKEYRLTEFKSDAEIHGRVLRPDGEPAAGAYVMPFIQADFWPGFDTEIYEDKATWRIGDDFTAVTASDGTFTIAKLPDGRYGLMVYSFDPRHHLSSGNYPRPRGPAAPELANFRPVMIEPFEVAAKVRGQEVTVRLEQGATLVVELTSTATGQPVVGMEIMLSVARVPEVPMPLVRLLPMAEKSDAKGLVRFAGMPAGSYFVNCCDNNEFTGPFQQRPRVPALKAGETVELKMKCTPKPGVPEK